MTYILTDEGRIVSDSGGFNYEYFIKDHLGNTRLVVKDNQGLVEVLQESHYYPFGLEISRLSFDNTMPENKYLYNGKELDTDFGLDWYDYGARYYDPIVPHFLSIDPMIEEHYNYSGYAYVYNDPMKLIDPFGLDTTNSVVINPDTNKPEPEFEIEEVTVKPDENSNEGKDEWWNWYPPHGVRYTLKGLGNLAGNEGRETDTWESGGDIGDFMSLLTGAIAMSFEKVYTGITSIFKWIDFSSDGFAEGNNAHPFSINQSKNKSTEVKTDSHKPVKERNSGDTTISIVKHDYGLYFKDTVIHKQDINKYKKRINYSNKIKKKYGVH